MKRYCHFPILSHDRKLGTWQPYVPRPGGAPRAVSAAVRGTLPLSSSQTCPVMLHDKCFPISAQLLNARDKSRFVQPGYERQLPSTVQAGGIDGFSRAVGR
jgi:hypothetical protein